MSSNLKNEYVPDVVSSPGETIFETLEEYGMSQAELAERMGRPKKTINEIIKGKAAISPDTAIQLEHVLGVPAGFWIRREQHYRESLARLAERERLSEATEWLSKMPVQEMVKKGWIRDFTDQVEQIEELLNYFAVASPKQWETVWLNPKVAFRKSLSFSSSPEALAAWLRKGEIEAQSISCAPYNADHFESALQEIRSLTTNTSEGFESQMRALCAEAGVAVVLVPQLSETRASGATQWLAMDKALLQLSLRYKKNDQFWFSFFHEAGHILLHGKRDAFIDDGQDRHDPQVNAEKEQEADRFAADFLIEPTLYQRFVASNKPFSKLAIQQFAAELGIAPGVLVGRLQHDKHLPFTHCNDLKETFSWLE